MNTRPWQVDCLWVITVPEFEQDVSTISRQRLGLHSIRSEIHHCCYAGKQEQLRASSMHWRLAITTAELRQGLGSPQQLLIATNRECPMREEGSQRGNTATSTDLWESHSEEVLVGKGEHSQRHTCQPNAGLGDPQR